MYAWKFLQKSICYPIRACRGSAALGANDVAYISGTKWIKIKWVYKFSFINFRKPLDVVYINWIWSGIAVRIKCICSFFAEWWKWLSFTKGIITNWFRKWEKVLFKEAFLIVSVLDFILLIFEFFNEIVRTYCFMEFLSFFRVIRFPKFLPKSVLDRLSLFLNFGIVFDKLFRFFFIKFRFIE